MTPYGAIHLAFATLCLFIAVVHALIWARVPPDRAQMWGVFSFVGLAALNLGIAGSGAASGHAFGDPRPWILIAFAGGSTLWWTPLLGAWAVLDEPPAPWRRATIAAIAGLSVARVADIARFVIAGGGAGSGVTFDEAYFSAATLLVVPAKLVTVGIAGALVAEGIGAARRKNAAARVILVAGIPSVVLMAREALISAGVLGGPTLVGLIGLPIMLAMTAIFGLRYIAVRAPRAWQDEVGGYRLLWPLGKGGMGELFLAVRTGPGGFLRHVALKRVRADSLDRRHFELLLEEARVAARLSHPNVVAVHDVGRLPNADWFIVMEYVPGVSLAEVRDRARQRSLALPLGFVAAVAEQIARGLAAAHELGIVHRDVSPHNVMMSFDGVAKVIDFGVARAGGPRAGEGVPGKPAYLAPETLDGTPATAASDVYALGIVLYELLAGVRPFQGSGETDLLAAIASGEYPPLETLRPDVGEDLLRVTSAALARDPARRPSAAALADRLAQARAILPPVDAATFVRRLVSDRWREHLRLALAEGVDDRSRAAHPAAARRNAPTRTS